MTVRHHCGNDRCDNGWITPLPSYIDAYAPTPPADPGPDAGPAVLAAYDRQVIDVAARRASLGTDVYPCKTCQPRQFHRWAQGHYRPGHDPSACAQCIEVRKGSPTLDEIIDAAPRPEPVPNTPDDDLDWTKQRADLR